MQKVQYLKTKSEVFNFKKQKPFFFFMLHSCKSDIFLEKKKKK